MRRCCARPHIAVARRFARSLSWTPWVAGACEPLCGSDGVRRRGVAVLHHWLSLAVHAVRAPARSEPLSKDEQSVLIPSALGLYGIAKALLYQQRKLLFLLRLAAVHACACALAHRAARAIVRAVARAMAAPQGARQPGLPPPHSRSAEGRGHP